MPTKEEIWAQVTDLFKTIHNYHLKNYSILKETANLEQMLYSSRNNLLAFFDSVNKIAGVFDYNAEFKSLLQANEKLESISVVVNSNLRSLVEQAIYLYYWDKKSDEKIVKFLKEISNKLGVTLSITGAPSPSSKHLIGAALDITVAEIKTNKRKIISTSTDYKKLRQKAMELLIAAANSLATSQGSSKKGYSTWAMIVDEPWHIELTNNYLLEKYPNYMKTLQGTYNAQYFYLNVLVEFYKFNSEDNIQALVNGLTALKNSVQYWYGVNSPYLLTIDDLILKAKNLGALPVQIVPKESSGWTFSILDLPISFDFTLADAYPFVHSLILPKFESKIITARVLASLFYDSTATKFAQLLKELNQMISTYGLFPPGVSFTHDELITLLELYCTSFNPFEIKETSSETGIGLLPSLPKSTVISTTYILPEFEFDKYDKKGNNKKLKLSEVTKVTVENLSKYIKQLNEILAELTKESNTKLSIDLNFIALQNIIFRILDIQFSYLKQEILNFILTILKDMKNPKNLYDAADLFSFVGLFTVQFARRYSAILKEYQKKNEGPEYFRKCYLKNSLYTEVNKSGSAQNMTYTILTSVVQNHLKNQSVMQSQLSRVSGELQQAIKEYENLKGVFGINQPSYDPSPDWEAWAAGLQKILEGKSVEESLPKDIKMKMLGHKITVLSQSAIWNKVKEKGLLSQFITYLQTGSSNIETVSTSDISLSWDKYKLEFEKYKNEIDKMMGVSKKEKIEAEIKEIANKAISESFATKDGNNLPDKWHIF